MVIDVIEFTFRSSVIILIYNINKGGNNMNISDTAYEILEYMWENPQGVKSQDIFEYFTKVKGRVWDKGTARAYLYKLDQENLLEKKRKGAYKYYTAALDKKDFSLRYEKERAAGFLERNYGGDLTNFVTALSGAEPSNIILEKAAELKHLIKIISNKE